MVSVLGASRSCSARVNVDEAVTVGGCRPGPGPPPPVTVMLLPPSRTGLLVALGSYCATVVLQVPGSVVHAAGAAPPLIVSTSLVGPPMEIVPAGTPSTTTGCPLLKPNSNQLRRSARVIVLPE